MYLVAETDGKVELDGLDGELTSCPGMELINLVFEGKPEIFPAAEMYWYVRVHIMQIYFERVIIFSDGTQNRA